MKNQGTKRGPGVEVDLAQGTAISPESRKRLKPAFASALTPPSSDADSGARISLPSQQFQSSSSPLNTSLPASFATVPNAPAPARPGGKAMRDALAVLQHLAQLTPAARSALSPLSGDAQIPLPPPASSFFFRQGFGPFVPPAMPPRTSTPAQLPPSPLVPAGLFGAQGMPPRAGQLAGILPDGFAAPGGAGQGWQGGITSRRTPLSKPPVIPPDPPQPLSYVRIEENRHLADSDRWNGGGQDQDKPSAAAAPQQGRPEHAMTPSRHPSGAILLNPFPPWQGGGGKGQSGARAAGNRGTSALPLMCGGWPVLAPCSNEEAESERAGGEKEERMQGGNARDQDGEADGGKEETGDEGDGMGISEFLDEDTEFWEDSRDEGGDRGGVADRGDTHVLQRVNELGLTRALSDRGQQALAVVAREGGLRPQAWLGPSSSASLTSSSDMWAPPLGPLLLPPVGLAGARSITMDSGEKYLKELRVAALSLVSAQTSVALPGIQGRSQLLLPSPGAVVAEGEAGALWRATRRVASMGTLAKFVSAAATTTPVEVGVTGLRARLELAKDDESHAGATGSSRDESSGGGHDVGEGGTDHGFSRESRRVEPCETQRRGRRDWIEEVNAGKGSVDPSGEKKPLKLFGRWV